MGGIERGREEKKKGKKKGSVIRHSMTFLGTKKRAIGKKKNADGDTEVLLSSPFPGYCQGPSIDGGFLSLVT